MGGAAGDTAFSVSVGSVLTHVESYSDDVERHGGVSDAAERRRLTHGQIKERTVEDTSETGRRQKLFHFISDTVFIKTP